MYLVLVRTIFRAGDSFRSAHPFLLNLPKRVGTKQAVLSQAGAIRLTTIAALLEWQRDWSNVEHYDALMGLLKQHAGAYGSGVEYAYTMVHKAPQSAQKPQVVGKKSH